MEFHLYMSFICMQRKCWNVQEFDHQEAVQHLWAHRGLGGWRALGPGGGRQGPPGGRHPTSTATSLIRMISHVSTSRMLKWSRFHPKERNKCHMDYGFSPHATSISNTCEATYLWSKLPLRMIWSHQMLCQFWGDSARHRILAPTTTQCRSPLIPSARHSTLR